MSAFIAISALRAFQTGKNLGACLLEELCADSLVADFKIVAFASAILGSSGSSLGIRTDDTALDQNKQVYPDSADKKRA